MKRFDVCWAMAQEAAGRRRLVVVLQHEVLSDLESVVVAPLYLAKDLSEIRQLRPKVRIGRSDYVLAVDRLASFPKHQLGDPTANLASSSYEITKALDLLFSGF